MNDKYKKFLDKGGNNSLVKLFLKKNASRDYQSIFHKYAFDVFCNIEKFYMPSKKEVEERYNFFLEDFKIKNYIEGQTIKKINNFFKE